MRTLALLALLASVPAAARTLTREEAVALALVQGPGLLGPGGEVAAARARLAGASGVQDNPELEARAGPRLREGGDSLDVEVGLSQPLALFGQGPARRGAAAAQLATHEAQLEARRVELAAEVREAFVRALAAGQVMRVAEEGVALARQSWEAARERLAAGAASRIEVNSARVELGRTERERAHADHQRADALGSLRLLLGLAPAEELTLAGELGPTGPEAPAAALAEQALAQRADVRAARAELAAARAEATLAAREALPVPRLGVSWAREEEAHVVQGTLGLELPLFQRNQASRSAAAARVQQAQGALEALERAVHAEVHLAASVYRAARAGAAVYGDEVLAAVEQNLELASEAYRAGKVDLFQLQLIRREALEARRGLVEALEELASAEARLQRALGHIR